MDVKICNINHHETREGYANPFLAIPNICYLPINIRISEPSYGACTVEKSDLQKKINPNHG